MMRPARAEIGLVRLGDSEFVLANPKDEVRGKVVYDAEGRRIGGVEDLYIDPQERAVRFLEVSAGGFLGIGEKRLLVPVEALTQVAADRVTIEPGRKEKLDGPAPLGSEVAPLREDGPREDHASLPRGHAEEPADQRRDIHSPLPYGRWPYQQAMAFPESGRSEADHAETYGGARPDAVWGFGGIMAKEILPARPADHRRRSRLCALRAMDRLGLLGEGNLIPTLARRPDLRWLADEEGARWAVLTELGRIGEPEVFEEAVEWALENRPSREEAKAYVCRLRARTRRPDGVGSDPP